MTVYLVYECDVWHTRSSQHLRGCYQTEDKAIAAILQHGDINVKRVAADWGIPPNHVLPYLRDELKEMKQTQGLETNYMIVPCSTNEWI